MPWSEQKLYEAAKPLMNSDNSVDWKDARRQYIATMLDRYPDGEHAEEAKGWLLKIDTTDLERRVERRIKDGDDPESEPERLYMLARDYEQFGDRLSAIEKYEAIRTLLKGNEGQRAYVNLAGQRITAIQATVGEEDKRITFVENQIKLADELFLSGKKLEARNKWQSIVRLYKEDPEFEFQVERSKLRILDPAGTIRAEKSLEAVEEVLDALQ